MCWFSLLLLLLLLFFLILCFPGFQNPRGSRVCVFLNPPLSSRTPFLNISDLHFTTLHSILYILLTPCLTPPHMSSHDYDHLKSHYPVVLTCNSFIPHSSCHSTSSSFVVHQHLMPVHVNRLSSPVGLILHQPSRHFRRANIGGHDISTHHTMCLKNNHKCLVWRRRGRVGGREGPMYSSMRGGEKRGCEGRKRVVGRTFSGS